jgi:NADH-quinone oxidoreductase subunit M
VLTFAPLLIMAFWIGLYPKPFFQILEQPVNQIVQNVRTPQANRAMNAAAQPEGAATPVTTAAVATPAPVQPAKGNN